ncbi:MAG TPA: Asp-tRNA(Asn)/Glu-tRNA(Gln) amidotransferase subunit GatC [Patescibacteria group bacterium]|nr:Asp-tRNA(Asn)/Glu-tRNA(Gln) amidotransferase subunit GatC [Patescibacteria group bacterium]
MTKLSSADVRKLARLCRLRLTDKEVELYQNDLSAILNYVEILQKVDIKGLEPTSQVTGLMNVVRPDEVIDYGASPDDLLKNAPAVEAHQFKVKRIIE